MYVTRYINYSITSYYIHVLLSIKGTSLELTFEMTLWRPILSRRTALVRVFVLTSGDNNFHILNGYNTVINQPPAYRRLAVNRGVRGEAAGWCGVNYNLSQNRHHKPNLYHYPLLVILGGSHTRSLYKRIYLSSHYHTDNDLPAFFIWK